MVDATTFSASANSECQPHSQFRDSSETTNNRICIHTRIKAKLFVFFIWGSTKKQNATLMLIFSTCRSFHSNYLNKNNTRSAIHLNFMLKLNDGFSALMCVNDVIAYLDNFIYFASECFLCVDSWRTIPHIELSSFVVHNVRIIRNMY